MNKRVGKNNLGYLIAGGLAVVLLAAACGSSSKHASSSSTTAAAGSGRSGGATEQPTGAPIVLGNIGTYSGAPSAATNAGGQQALTAWEDSVNAAGGINGHPVKVIFKDDQNAPATGLLDAKDLVQQHVIAIIGEQSDTDSAWGPYLKSVNIPVIGGVSFTTEFATDSDFFPSGTTLAPMQFGSISLAQKGGGTKLGVIYCAESPLCAKSVPFYKAIGQVLGVPVVYSTKVSATQPDYTAACLAAKGAGADMLTIAEPSPIVIRVVSGCSSQGYKPLLTESAASASGQWLTTPALSGATLSSPQAPWTDTSIPGVKAYRDALAKYEASVLGSPTEDLVTALQAWAGGVELQAAIKAAGVTGVPSSADVVKGLNTFNNETLGGLAPPLTFREGVPHSVPCYFGVSIKDGAFSSLNNGQMQCVSDSDLKQLAG